MIISLTSEAENRISMFERVGKSIAVTHLALESHRVGLETPG